MAIYIRKAAPETENRKSYIRVPAASIVLLGLAMTILLYSSMSDERDLRRKLFTTENALKNLLAPRMASLCNERASRENHKVKFKRFTWSWLENEDTSKIGTMRLPSATFGMKEDAYICKVSLVESPTIDDAMIEIYVEPAHWNSD